MEPKEIYKKYLQGKMNLQEAITEIDKGIGGLTAVYYTPQKMTVQNHTCKVSFDTREQNKSTVKRRENLALGIYDYVRQNGQAFCGELHINEEASTKHHKIGIEERINNLCWT